MFIANMEVKRLSLLYFIINYINFLILLIINTKDYEISKLSVYFSFFSTKIKINHVCLSDIRCFYFHIEKDINERKYRLN